MPDLSPAHTRAWIETSCGGIHEGDDDVARSHAGVDRNLLHAGWIGVTLGRPLTRGRGSKQLGHALLFNSDAESPAHTRAWIETPTAPPTPSRSDRRPLTRGRGSKLQPDGSCVNVFAVARSHAGVDRNQFMQIIGYVGFVARSHAGVDRNGVVFRSADAISRSPAHTRAWIETYHLCDRPEHRLSPAHTRAWIETPSHRRAPQTP